MHACRETLDFAIRGCSLASISADSAGSASGGIVRGVLGVLRLGRRERRRLNVAKGRMARLALIQYRSSRRLRFQLFLAGSAVSCGSRQSDTAT